MSGFAVLRDKQDKNEMIEDNKVENSETLGNKLQNARKELNLSIEDVANKLRLKSAVIERFENDIFTLPDLPATFTKGYLRSYVRLLKLPDELFENTVCSGTKIPNIKPMEMKPQNKPCRGLLKVITVLVLLIAFGMTLLWWWQNYQQEQQQRDTLVTNGDNVTLQANTTEQPKATLESNEVEVILPKKEENKVNIVDQNVNADSDEQVVNGVKNSQSDDVKDESVNDNLTIDTEKQTNVLLQNHSDESASANVQSEEQLKVEQSEAIKDDLRIEIISAPSWITVRGDNRKNLASKIYKAGEVLTFNDNKRYRLTIGAPVNVKVYYKGKVIPLKLDGRVARIKLP